MLLFGCLDSFDISRIETLYIDTSRRHDSRERAAATVELRSNRSVFLQVLLFKRESCTRKKVMNISRGCRAFVEIFHVSNIACYRCHIPIWTSLRRRFAWIDRTDCKRLCIFHVSLSPKCTESAIYARPSSGMCMSSFCK